MMLKDKRAILKKELQLNPRWAFNALGRPMVTVPETVTSARCDSPTSIGRCGRGAYGSEIAASRPFQTKLLALVSGVVLYAVRR